MSRWVAAPTRLPGARLKRALRDDRVGEQPSPGAPRPAPCVLALGLPRGPGVVLELVEPSLDRRVFRLPLRLEQRVQLAAVERPVPGPGLERKAGPDHTGPKSDDDLGARLAASGPEGEARKAAPARSLIRRFREKRSEAEPSRRFSPPAPQC